MKPLSPKQRYLIDLKEEGFQSNPAQEKIITKLEKLYCNIIKNEKRIKLFRKKNMKGLYLWGKVGRGKTYMMDIFFESLPLVKKQRIHYHEFMKNIHRELKMYQGQTDPLKLIAKKIARDTQILCFDEFFVFDIANAMLLGELFKYLFQEGIVLLATSNVPPDELYKNGLQRQKFLPAIELLKKYMDIIEVETHQDFRLRTLEHQGSFFMPDNEFAKKNMLTTFYSLAKSIYCEGENILINNREIQSQRASQDIIWFDFLNLCSIPRSQLDYIEIAKQYKTVFISGLNKIDDSNYSLIRNFISLIDVLYDQKIKLILASNVELERIYTQGQLTMEFERTHSRLIEMQSHEYLRQTSR